MNIELLKKLKKKFSLNESKFLDVNWWLLARYKLFQSYYQSNRASKDVIKFSFKLVFNLIKRSLLFFKILLFFRRKKTKCLFLGTQD